MSKKIGLPLWQRLYEAGEAYKKMAPWQWMYDSDLFGVRNPPDGIVGYCSVMGAAGEHFALGVYVGTAGLNSFYRAMESAEKSELPDADTAFSQYCLMASWEDRDQLAPEDREVIKKLGLRFRGRNNWPLFRSFRPGYFPWFLTREEAEFLIVALEQAVELCPRIREEPTLLRPKGNQTEAYLVRSPRKRGRKITWEDEVVVPEADSTIKPIPVPPVDQIRVNEILKKNDRVANILEFDSFLFPGPIREKESERPYLPAIQLWVEQQSGLILHQDILPAPERYDHISTGLYQLLEQTKIVPAEIWIEREEIFLILAPVCKTLKIRLELVTNLPAAQEAKDHLMNWLGNQ